MRSTSENADIFTARDEKYLVFAEKKSKFSFYFLLNGNTEITTLLLLGRFSFDLTFAECLLGITLGVNVVCT